jgi:hypothetical protein
VDYRENPASVFALGVGATFLAAGIAGFSYEATFSADESVRDGVLGVLDVNGWHNLVHMATGLVGLGLARSHPREFALGFGLTYLVVAVWGFVVGDGRSILSIVPVNTETTSSTCCSRLAGLRSTQRRCAGRLGLSHRGPRPPERCRRRSSRRKARKHWSSSTRGERDDAR